MATIRVGWRPLAIVLCLAPMISAGRAEAWRYWIDGVGTTGHALDVAVDGAGHVAAAGYSSGAAPIARLDGTTGEELWRFDFNGIGAPVYGYYGEVWRAVATDAAGDVVAAGVLSNTGTTSDFTVIKLAAADGAELWRRAIDGDGIGDMASDVVVDGNGDVVAVGALTDATDPGDYLFSAIFTVIKFAGDTGAELWRRQLGGSFFLNLGTHLVVDAAGDVVAMGRVGTNPQDLVIAKLDGGDGSVLWTTVLDDVNGYALALDGAGDVFLGGNFLVVKLAAATGAVLWEAESGGATGSALAITVDGADDVIAVGGILYAGGVSKVAKLDGATGAFVWGQDVADYALVRVARDGAGDVIAGGVVRRPGEQDIAVIKLDGATGAEVWREEVDGTTTRPDGQTLYPEDVHAFATDSGNNVVVAAALHNGGTNPDSDGDFTVLELGALDGVVGPVAGRRLLVSDRAGDPARRRISGVALDTAISVPASGSAADPTTNGATITLQNPTTSESATLTLPAGASWEALGNPPGSRGYKYTDPDGVNGPCKLLLIKRGSMRASCRGNLGPIPFTLDEASQGSLVLSTRLGAGAPQCMRFGGAIRKDAGTANPGPQGTFAATKATAFSGTCP